MDETENPSGTKRPGCWSTPRRPAVPRRPLDQMRILRAAVEFIDVNGLGRLTMRRLGARLGVEAMALYRYVPGSRAAAGRRGRGGDGRAVRVHPRRRTRHQLAGVPADAGARGPHPRRHPPADLPPGGDPATVRALAATAAAQSAVGRVVPAGAAGVRLRPRRSASLVYRSFATFLLGALLLEAGTLEDLTITDKVNLAFIESDDLSSYPIISEMAAELEGGRVRDRVRGRAGGPDRAGRGDAH